MRTTSGVSGSNNIWAALNTQRQAKMFAKVDTDGSGSVDATELSTLLSDVSKKTGVSLGDSKELFTQMDSNQDGSLSSDELAQGLKDLLPPPSTLDFAHTRGAGHGDGGGGPGGPGGSGGAPSASQSSSYDPLDANQDGVVSELERLVGQLQSAASALGASDSTGNSASDTANSKSKLNIADLAQQIYAQVAAGLAAQNGSLVSVSA